MVNNIYFKFLVLIFLVASINAQAKLACWKVDKEELQFPNGCTENINMDPAAFEKQFCSKTYRSSGVVIVKGDACPPTLTYKDKNGDIKPARLVSVCDKIPSLMNPSQTYLTKQYYNGLDSKQDKDMCELLKGKYSAK